MLAYAAIDLELRTGQALYGIDRNTRQEDHLMLVAPLYEQIAITVLNNNLKDEKTASQPSIIWAIVCLLAIKVGLFQTSSLCHIPPHRQSSLSKDLE
jgi:hypothetical protein